MKTFEQGFCVGALCGILLTIIAIYMIYKTLRKMFGTTVVFYDTNSQTLKKADVSAWVIDTDTRELSIQCVNGTGKSHIKNYWIEGRGLDSDIVEEDKEYGQSLFK